MKVGTVIGSSDKIGGYPDEDTQKPENFAATIFDALEFPEELIGRTWADAPTQFIMPIRLQGLPELP